MLKDFVENVKYRIIKANNIIYKGRQFEVFVEKDKFSPNPYISIVFYLVSTPYSDDEKICFKDEETIRQYFAENGIEYTIDKEYAKESILYYEAKISQLKKLYDL